MKYHVCISQTIPLHENAEIYTFFVESDKTACDIEKDIIEFNKKEGGREVQVTVSLVPKKLTEGFK
jgi:hypothetical protein